MPSAVRVAAVAVLTVMLMSFGAGARLSAQPAAPQPTGVTVPSIPDPVPVTLDPSTTAFLALDFLDSNCGPRPPCIAALPAVASGLAAARAAKVPVIYSVVGGGQILDPVAPMPADAVVMSVGADKFSSTNLDDMLKQQGITTVVVTGTSSNGAVLYTSFEAAARGYTVVLAEDGISASTDFATQFTEWQLLNGPGTTNPQNMPLQPKMVTLSRLDLITYG